MYNKLYKHLQENNILYRKQFGFQKSNSTVNAIIELADEISKSFDKNKFILGVFIDLSKAFDTVDHDILLKKLSIYGIKNNNLNWLKSYLQRKQYISFAENKTETLQIRCGVPQGSILGPLLFLLYVNDLSKASKMLNSIMFDDDTNLFYSHRNIITLFQIVNTELVYLNEWFRCNKLSLNTDKTKYTFFHKLSKTDHIPLILPKLKINNEYIERETSIKFLGVILDENLTWNKHIHVIENKISKNIGILFKAKYILNQKCLKSIYFSFIHSYINHANIVWASTNHTKLKKLYKQQKHASRIIYNEERMTHFRPLMKSLNALNIYQLNIYQNLVLVFKTKNNLNLIFKEKFRNINHKYPTNFSTNNLYVPKNNILHSTFAISTRGPYLWNNFLSNEEKSLINLSPFIKTIKTKLFNNTNEITFF